MEPVESERKVARPALVFVETVTWPKNADGVIKCKYSEATTWDVICCITACRDPKYGKWVVKPPDSGLKPWTPAEKKANAAFAKSYKALYRKYRGSNRWQYGFEPITRLLIILDVVIMAFLYTASHLQSAMVTLWAGVQTLVLAMICPFNR